MSRRFNFDDFDAQIAEALEEHGTPLPERQPNPGEIGGVVCTPLFKEWFGEEYPDDAA